MHIDGFCLTTPHWDLKPQSTTLKASNLTIRPPMQFIITDVVSLNLDQGEVYNIM
jgi:hypothetical protein